MNLLVDKFSKGYFTCGFNAKLGLPLHVSLIRLFTTVAMQIHALSFDQTLIRVDARAACIEYARRVEQEVTTRVTKCETRTGVNRTLFCRGSRATAQLLSATSHARVI